ncbi:MAG: hypothetical protein NVS9B1_05210 [Candidatus Dormibacteraceae bacterium]
MEQVNGPRTRGRAGALALAIVVAGVVAPILLHGISIRTVYARPLLPAFEFGPPTPSRPLADQPTRTWDVLPPGSGAVVPLGRQSVQVPILMYHYVRVKPDPRGDQLGYGLSVSPDEFRSQMDYLDDHGFHPVTIEDLRNYLAGRNALPDRPVVLTFDDGYADLYTGAVPVLREHNFKAVAYIVSGFVGSPASVTAAQVQEMDRNGIEIGAHTFDHRDLTKMDAVAVSHELIDSKAQLEAMVGHPVVDFCYPAGKYNAAVASQVQTAGYESATTTGSGASHSLGDRYTWTRVRVAGGESIVEFARGLTQHETGIAPANPTMIRLPRAFPLVYVGPLAELQ